jgi:osmotically-inducible protein OsmY
MKFSIFKTLLWTTVLVGSAPLSVSGAETGSGSPENGATAKQDTQRHRQSEPMSLASRAYMALATSPSLRSSTFEVSAKDGVVTVRGVVPNEEAKRRAVHLAGTPRGADKVVDELRVDDSAVAAPVDVAGDAALAEKVSRAIAAEFPDSEATEEWAYGWEIDHEEWAVDVDVDLGYVFLAGTVPTWPAAKEMVDTARRIPGVVGVGQRLRVGSPKKHDRGAVGYGFDEDAYWYDRAKQSVE